MVRDIISSEAQAFLQYDFMTFGCRLWHTSGNEKPDTAIGYDLKFRCQAVNHLFLLTQSLKETRCDIAGQHSQCNDEGSKVCAVRSR